MNAINTKINNLFSKIPHDIISLIARIAVAMVFWRSAQTKFSGWEFLGQKWQFFNLNDSTFMLFEYEYALPVLPPEIAAYLATFGEFFLSLALLFGFLTRLSALGLIVMTAVIQIFVYPEAWPTHILWFAPLLYLVKEGGGIASLDKLIFK
ncbi:DoxX family protein [Psychrobium sp. 1_MG-2023]|uniref:DoxX family protein n=1 Tax=Psychrobium sp. 1_MG-2023 TaxID=3062624 RepID=UPI000C335F6E|nr:DoxX family protein [Psychrobium sp. 1_MG-2023]MDP2561169.1 DoxX family protein [Psychrobium sp. 1_MG-2023]PKF55142.1 DoxX family protein [Alteromonadales bacterium alter-6D02]